MTLEDFRAATADLESGTIWVMVDGAWQTPTNIEIASEEQRFADGKLLDAEHKERYATRTIRLRVAGQ